MKIEQGQQFLTEIPLNCIFNKVVTGCGGTTVCLNNEVDYVVCVPTTELIVNKTRNLEAGISKCGRYFGMFGKYSVQMRKELQEYIRVTPVKKIICTYDKLPKVCELIEVSKYNLLVDEYQQLLKAYGYRDKAVNGVLDNYNKFANFTFMSATPIMPEFCPDKLSGVKMVEAEWSEVDTLVVSLQKTNKPYQKVANIIKGVKRDGFLDVNGVKSYELFFFINSVTDIKKILDQCNLVNEDVRIICADTDKNRSKLGYYEIGTSISDNKMFNFITSKGFEGCDYQSETGICFVVSTVSNPHTQASIDTDIPQIAGRIRTKSNPFRNIIIHIFSTAQNKDVEQDYDYHKNRVQEQIRLAKQKVDMFNSASDELKESLIKDYKKAVNEHYIRFDEQKNEFKMDDIIPKLELYNYKINHIIYSSGISLVKNYQSSGILTTNISWEQLVEDEKESKKAKRMTFKEVFDRYADSKKDLTIDFGIDELLNQFPLVREAYDKLGVEEVKKLRYNQKQIKQTILSADDSKSKDFKAFKVIRSQVSNGEWIPTDKAKQLVSEAFRVAGISETATGKKLERWFDIKELSKKVDKKAIRGFVIERSKILFVE